MDIKYLGTKVAAIVLSVAAVPVVWGALAWPEWSAASEVAPSVVAAPPSNPMEPPPTQPQPEPVIIRRIIVERRYVYVPSATGEAASPSAGPVATATPLAGGPAVPRQSGAEPPVQVAAVEPPTVTTPEPPSPPVATAPPEPPASTPEPPPPPPPPAATTAGS
jgi:hypothetical protein